MNSSQAKDITSTLVGLTTAGDLVWETGVTQWYWADYKRYTYVIRSVDQDNRHPFAFEVYPVEAADASHAVVRVESSEEDLDEDATNSIELLYETARHSAESAGDLFTAIMDDLRPLSGE